MGLYKKEAREIRQLKEAEVVINLVSKIKTDQPRLSVRKIQGMIQDDLDKQGIKDRQGWTTGFIKRIQYAGKKETLQALLHRLAALF